jgi:hypothetical protein
VAKNVERRFIALRVDPENVSSLSEEGNGLILNLADPIDQYQDEWNLASHTFTIAPEGHGIITFVFERPY